MQTGSTAYETAAVEQTGFAGRRWEWTRTVLGVVYLFGGVAHVALGLAAPEIYEEFADQALVSAYADLWASLVVPNLAVLQPLVAVFELALGAALLWWGRAVRAGHAVGAVFQAGLVLSGPWGPVNALLAVVHLAALRRSYPATVVDLVRRRTDRGPE